jgi:hypothetical protein
VPDIEFGNDGKCTFPSKYHGDVTISRTKWDIICDEPERRYYRFNGEKIATTLINPDSVRHHKFEKNQFFYYKKFLRICSDTGIEISCQPGIFFAVVIDASTSRICTVYPVEQPKTGKAFIPPKHETGKDKQGH